MIRNIYHFYLLNGRNKVWLFAGLFTEDEANKKYCELVTKYPYKVFRYEKR